MMNRRAFLSGLALASGLLGSGCLALAATPAPSAIAGTPISVVKVINFGCPACRASESLDSLIKEEAEKHGGRFAYAAISAEDSIARERVYYAMRSYGSELETRTRQSFYRAVQDLGYPLSDMGQVIVWLQQDFNDSSIDWAAIAQKAETKEITDAAMRAIRITVKAGAQVTPTYILVQGANVIAVLDVQSVAGNSLVSLREAVVQKLKSQK